MATCLDSFYYLHLCFLTITCNETKTYSICAQVIVIIMWMQQSLQESVRGACPCLIRQHEWKHLFSNSQSESVDHQRKWLWSKRFVLVFFSWRKWIAEWNNPRVSESLVLLILSYLIVFSMWCTGPVFTKRKELKPSHKQQHLQFHPQQIHTNVKTKERLSQRKTYENFCMIGWAPNP